MGLTIHLRRFLHMFCCANTKSPDSFLLHPYPKRRYVHDFIIQTLIQKYIDFFLLINGKQQRRYCSGILELVCGDKGCFDPYNHSAIKFTPDTNYNHFVYEEYIRAFFRDPSTERPIEYLV